jgi:predicted transcriptional regulator
MVQVDIVEMIEKLDNIANSYESSIKAAEHKAAMKTFNQRVASGEVKPAKRADVTDEDIVNMYNAGMSAYKMAKEIDLTQQAILYRLKKLKESGIIK